MEIRLIILPSANIRNKTRQLALTYAKAGPHFFVVDNKSLIPHVTLFKVDIDKRSLDQLSDAINIQSRELSPMNLELYKLYGHSEGWLVWNIRSSGKLNNLRKKIAQAVRARAREGIVLKSKYSPHITLTKYKDAGLAKTVAKNRIALMAWKADTIAVTLSDKHSQVYKILSTHTLK